ncbi:MAG: rRNA maturation RNase YbeY [Brevinematia bacterium]
MIKVNVLDKYNDKSLSFKNIRFICEYVLKELSVDRAELTVVICSDDDIRKYNKEFRNKDYPTDVLSFPYGEKLGRYVYLGDIIISMDRVYSQSYEYDVKPFEEFVRLLVHGVLHLLGYDHETSEDDERKMMELQDRLIDEILVSFEIG